MNKITVTLWLAKKNDSDMELVFESDEGKVTTIYFTGVSQSILNFIHDDSNRLRIRQALEEAYKYEYTEEMKIIY